MMDTGVDCADERNNISARLFDESVRNSKSVLVCFAYSVLRLRSQPTRPMPMLPNKIALGAGITT